ncbi:MAG: T9SS type A sorting domain-containing protein [Ignavibacteria bacterium]
MTDFDGSNLSSGVYFYKIQTNNFSQTKRMILLK